MNNNYFGGDNHHFTKNVGDDARRLLTRLELFYKSHRPFPTDEDNMRHFGWSKDRINRCYQLLKEQRVVDYARNHRRTTLHFNDRYSVFNDWMKKEKR